MREGDCNPLRGMLSIAREIDLPGPSPMLAPRQVCDPSPFLRCRSVPSGTNGAMPAEEFVGKVLDLLHHEGDPMERIRTKMAYTRAHDDDVRNDARFAVDENVVQTTRHDRGMDATLGAVETAGCAADGCWPERCGRGWIWQRWTLRPLRHANHVHLGSSWIRHESVRRGGGRKSLHPHTSRCLVLATHLAEVRRSTVRLLALESERWRLRRRSCRGFRPSWTCGWTRSVADQRSSDANTTTSDLRFVRMDRSALDRFPVRWFTSRSIREWCRSGLSHASHTIPPSSFGREAVPVRPSLRSWTLPRRCGGAISTWRTSCPYHHETPGSSHMWLWFVPASSPPGPPGPSKTQGKTTPRGASLGNRQGSRDGGDPFCPDGWGWARAEPSSYPLRVPLAWLSLSIGRGSLSSGPATPVDVPIETETKGNEPTNVSIGARAARPHTKGRDMPAPAYARCASTTAKGARKRRWREGGKQTDARRSEGGRKRARVA